MYLLFTIIKFSSTMIVVLSKQFKTDFRINSKAVMNSWLVKHK